MNHYSAIKGVIEHIVKHKFTNHSLDDLSQSLKVSRGHLQKIFTEWAGISPKQFSRYLSLQYSKNLLAQNKKISQTQATVRSGLSSAGRLYDLFVDIEAMTPGEYQNGGADLLLQYSIFQTPFGMCLVASTARGICNILFADSAKEALNDLQTRWPKARLLQKDVAAHSTVRTYFSGISRRSKVKPKIKLHLHGSNFQIKVWEALLSIPAGAVSSYGEIAERIGDRNLSRAVGAAVGDNPIGFIIPCHRVLKSTGAISGYRWGIERKRAMLGYEAIQKNKE